MPLPSRSRTGAAALIGSLLLAPALIALAHEGADAAPGRYEAPESTRRGWSCG